MTGITQTVAQTIGEHRVRTKFNPSADGVVEQVKHT